MRSVILFFALVATAQADMYTDEIVKNWLNEPSAQEKRERRKALEAQEEANRIQQQRLELERQRVYDGYSPCLRALDGSCL